MKRESLLTGAAVALAIAACASAPPGGDARVSARPFVSDRLTVVTRGTGRDIILVPGLVSHRDVWAGVAERLEDRYRLHLVQVNGFAGLPAGANADGPVAAPVAEEIARYIGEARLSRPAVIGHSLGGSIGLMLAARHPDLVGRLMRDHLAGRLPAVIGPERLWSYAFVDDVAEAHVAALTHQSPARDYIVGGVNAPQQAIYDFLQQTRGRPVPRRLPRGLALAAAVAYRLTGSDKGVW